MCLLNLKPGNGLMAKRILADPKVMNLITQSLTRTNDDYFIGNCEWNNGTRSDMVLEPKNAHSGLPPLILEIQHTVNLAFMKRAVNYCLQASTRYDSEPTILIICVEQLQEDIFKHAKPSKLPGVFTYFSQPWAENCFIISKESMQDNMATPLDPLMALGSFFTSSSASLANHIYKDDPTVKYLYTLALFQQQMDSINKDTPYTLIDLQLMEYDRLVALASTFSQPLLEEAVNEAKSRTLTIKRRYEDVFTAEPSSSKKSVIVPSPSSYTTKADKDNAYKAAMEFVVEFKQKKMEQERRMDWIACLKEGTELNILNYKNTDSLRRQFYKYMKGIQNNNPSS